MKINGRKQVGYSQRELADRLRVDPTLDISNAVLIDAETYNKALNIMFSDNSPLAQWEDCADDPDWHLQQQEIWFMPKYYAEIDIAELLISRCENQDELQRMGQELMMFQDRNLLPMLNYLHYLVETLRENKVILGVGRGSSVSSFALYKLGVHKVNSLYWDLDINEFLKGEVDA